MGRNCPWWVVVLGVCLPLAGMAVTDMPAQDGLKFLRLARQFQAQPWSDVVRSADQHPLYPYLISRVEPVVSRVLGEGPRAWTRSAQLVSLAGALLALTAVYRLGMLLFDRTTGVFAALLWLAAPGAVAISRETLSDSLALGLFGWTLCLAVDHWRSGSARAGVGMGILAGLGYWTRPEAIVLPSVFGGLVLARHLATHARRSHLAGWSRGSGALVRPTVGLLAFCFLVGSYAMVKGELSEKLALRRAAAIPSVHDAPRKTGHALPAGLDDPRWDFSPKEEGGPATPFSAPAALVSMANRWAGSLGWVIAVAAIAGAMRVRAGAGRLVVGAYAGLFTLVLLRHAMGLGYLSDRHMLTLSMVAVPWAAAGLLRLSRRLTRRGGWSNETRGRRRLLTAAALVVVGLLLQLKPAHASREGHQEAACWLAEQVEPGESLYDSRGWAAFLSGIPAYDAWHIKQALSDSHLAYFVVGQDELDSDSPRSRTLRAILGHAAQPVARFEAPAARHASAVVVYRYQRPESWEGLNR